MKIYMYIIKLKSQLDFKSLREIFSQIIYQIKTNKSLKYYAYDNIVLFNRK